MMLDTPKAYPGPVLRGVVNALLISSLFACVLSFHNVVARYMSTLGNEKVLPARLGDTSPKHHAPSFASVVQTATASVLLLVFASSDWTRWSASSAPWPGWPRSAGWS